MTEHTIPRLLPTSWTSAGDATPQSPDERSPIPVRTRIEAVAAHGWQGFGLVADDLAEFLRSGTHADLAALLQDHGITHLELEFLGDWWSDGERRRRSDRVRRELLGAAEALGARTVKIAPAVGGESVDPGRFAEEFDRLASEAGEHGTRVALETLPFSSNAPTLEDGIALVTEVGNPAGGLCVDVWHVHRGGTDYSIIRDRLPAEYLFVVELDDAAAAPVGTLWEDTVHRRLLPGRGAFDVPEFINAIRATGYDGIWGVEMISEHHRSLPLAAALAQTREATLACFAEADRRFAAGSRVAG
ncbi:sugar phosphate isomerase/epimerase [Leucobacter allii]|uniref:sugar phosphate isomerase/epimerase family protein n=1 Tax=Leucobacter allii TaxID=2932247 RepID=UPI001FD18277|nr:sugar phosphate isomerase/epimerase family protein [Leucobacter allii]UOR01334.1 sugar phosphate isomerase/epimerase [Leucobacter allii]